jgi:hypothetical protein
MQSELLAQPSNAQKNTQYLSNLCTEHRETRARLSKASRHNVTSTYLHY